MSNINYKFNIKKNKGLSIFQYRHTSNYLIQCTRCYRPSGLHTRGWSLLLEPAGWLWGHYRHIVCQSHGDLELPLATDGWWAGHSRGLLGQGLPTPVPVPAPAAGTVWVRTAEGSVTCVCTAGNIAPKWWVYLVYWFEADVELLNICSRQIYY